MRADIGIPNRILLNRRIAFIKNFEVAIHQNLVHSSSEAHQWIGPGELRDNIGPFGWLGNLIDISNHKNSISFNLMN